MALAPLAHVLFTRTMTYDATAPGWADRDRFILSPGHASILQYAMLHLTGFGLTLDDLRQFRQWQSATPGHPEVGHTAGVEVTTGPLGQGFANGVGMGIAQRHLAARLGRDLVDHTTFVMCSDGDLSEGVSHEAASLAGHLGLGRLVYIYDDNRITIDGRTELSLSDDASKRFDAYGWHVEDIGEPGDDLDTIEAALDRAVAVTDAPSLVIMRTRVGYPSPTYTDDPKAHGLVILDEEVAATKSVLGLPVDQPFHVPDDVAEFYLAAGRRGASARQGWQARLGAYSGDRAELDALWAGGGVSNWATNLPRWTAGEKLATRVAGQACLEATASAIPGLIGGGADITGNTGTKLPADVAFTRADPAGRQLYFGVREHAMGSLLVGMAHHGGVVPFGGTFLVFSDYMRPAVRMAALSGAHAIFWWSHDSIGVGEDGPTHQPVEQIASLRAIPGFRLIRPADANETAQAWRLAVDLDGPTGIVTSRQGVPVLEGTVANPEGVARGGYALNDADGDPDVILVGAGTEVTLCVDAAKALGAEGIAARVVSLPCWDIFEDQDARYRHAVLPPAVPTVSVEAGTTMGWSRYAQDNIGLDRFGASAPGDEVMAQFGFTAAHVADRARALVR